MADNFIQQITLPDSTTYSIHALQWIDSQAVYVDLATASTSNTINGNSTTALSIGVDGTLPISSGGTGSSTAPIQYGVIYANSTTNYASTSACSEGNPLIGSSTAPYWYTGLTFTGSTTSDFNTDFEGTISFSTTSTFGDEYTPIYWNDGKPDIVAVTRKYDFTLNGTVTSITQSHANKIDTIVTQIVVNDGIEYLKSPLQWAVTTTASTTAAAGTIIISTNTATGGNVSGYILASTGT